MSDDCRGRKAGEGRNEQRHSERAAWDGNGEGRRKAGGQPDGGSRKAEEKQREG